MIDRLFPAFCGSLLVWLGFAGATLADTSSPPTITVQPTNGIAGVGEDFAFSVQASSVTTFTYQWLLNGGTLASQTNTFLLLTNLTVAQSGTYSVTVASAAGSTTSSNAILTVLDIVPRRLGTGRILQVGSQVGVPITFRASGRESAVSFSLLYDTNAYANPTYLAANANAASVINLTQSGAIGLTLTLPMGTIFPAGNQWLGLIQFDLAGGFGPLQGGLAFSTNPVPISAVNSNGLALIISAGVEPQYVLSTHEPQLRLQSGLFEHQLVIGNPGPTVITNLDILTLNLGVDSLTNAITFYNAEGTLTNYPFGDSLVDVGCDCACGAQPGAPANNACEFNGYLDCGKGNCSLDYAGTNAPLPFAQINNLVPGEARLVTIEFYVPDHFTIPTPKYSLSVADPFARAMPAYATTLTINASRFVNGAFLVEFPTQLALHYYIEYASTPDALATNAQIALPRVTGNGGIVQWIDNGPPKTDSQPMNDARFYRILQTP